MTKILVVHNTPETFDQIAELYREQAEILEAHNGSSALAAILQHHPDLVLAEWEIQGFSGLTLCEKIKQDASLNDIYFILLSEANTVEQRIISLETGADDFVSVPFENRELHARINAGLRVVQTRQQVRQKKQEVERAYEQIQRDLEVVAEIQMELLPDDLPDLEGYEFGADYTPSAQAGGDYFDIIPISSIHAGLVIADVSGHGTPAAVVMAITRVIMRAFVQDLLSPAGAIKLINRTLYEHVPTEQFVTLFYGILNTRTGHLAYSSAGHNPPIYYRAADKQVMNLSNAGGLPLKIIGEAEYGEDSLRTAPGDILLMYTDGVTEALSPNGTMFSDTKLAEILSQNTHQSAADLIKVVKSHVMEFVGTTPIVDDMTLMAVRRTPQTDGNRVVSQP